MLESTLSPTANLKHYARQGTAVFVGPPAVALPTSGVVWWPYSYEGPAGFGTVGPVPAQPSPPPALAQGPPSSSTAAISPAPPLTTSLPPGVSALSVVPQTPTPSSSSQTVTTSATATSSSTRSTSSPVITITASKPAAYDSANPPFKLWLLGPIVGGAVLLLVLLVCVLCRRRRRQRKENAFEAGPRYEAAEAKPFLLGADAQKGSHLLNPYDARGGPDAHGARSAAASPTDRASLAPTQLSERPESESAYSPTSYAVSRATTLHAPTTRAGSPATSPVDAPRRASLQQGLLDRIQSEIRREKGYRQIDEDEDGTEKEDAAGSGAPSPTSAVSGPGFRIVEDEHPASPGLADEHRKSWLAWTRSWSASSVDIAAMVASATATAPEKPAPAHPSHFTPKPTRRREKEKSRSGASTPTRSRPPSRTAATYTVPLALPASPPLVSSPQLDAALSFGAPVPVRRPARRSQKQRPSAGGPPAQEKEKELPVPNEVAEGKRRRGREARPRGERPRPRQSVQVGEVMPGTRAVSPQEREGAALRKVNTIVLRGYEQQLAAASAAPGADVPVGILQRLDGV